MTSQMETVRWWLRDRGAKDVKPGDDRAFVAELRCADADADVLERVLTENGATRVERYPDLTVSFTFDAEGGAA